MAGQSAAPIARFQRYRATASVLVRSAAML